MGKVLAMQHEDPRSDFPAPTEMLGEKCIAVTPALGRHSQEVLDSHLSCAIEFIEKTRSQKVRFRIGDMVQWIKIT